MLDFQWLCNKGHCKRSQSAAKIFSKIVMISYGTIIYRERGWYVEAAHNPLQLVDTGGGVGAGSRRRRLYRDPFPFVRLLHLVVVRVTERWPSINEQGTNRNHNPAETRQKTGTCQRRSKSFSWRLADWSQPRGQMQGQAMKWRVESPDSFPQLPSQPRCYLPAHHVLGWASRSSSPLRRYPSPSPLPRPPFPLYFSSFWPCGCWLASWGILRWKQESVILNSNKFGASNNLRDTKQRVDGYSRTLSAPYQGSKEMCCWLLLCVCMFPVFYGLRV